MKGGNICNNSNYIPVCLCIANIFGRGNLHSKIQDFLLTKCTGPHWLTMGVNETSVGRDSPGFWCVLDANQQKPTPICLNIAP